jgi:hypothetical protein
MKPGLLSENVREACDSNVAGRPMQTAGRIESTVDCPLSVSRSLRPLLAAFR